MPTYDFMSLIEAVSNRLESEGCSQRELVRRLGEPPEFQAVISKVLRGETVSRETARRILRALGLLPPARRYHRVCMTPEEFAAWRRMTPQQRREALGL